MRRLAFPPDMKALPGVQLAGVHPWMLAAAGIVDESLDYYGWGRAVITGGREPAPGRVRDTLHPAGMALDFRFWMVPEFLRLAYADMLRYFLGEAFQVHVEKNHYHIELSPAALAYLGLGPGGRRQP